VISGSRQVLQRLTYEAFGGVRTTKGEGARTSYIGREEDNESGFGFYGVRLYEPEYGRYISIDKMFNKF
jgi:RHS repeat-associated protein